jgi:hypothetical protein
MPMRAEPALDCGACEIIERQENVFHVVAQAHTIEELGAQWRCASGLRLTVGEAI